METPIKDNRIVFDRTFAIRLKAFVESVEVSDCAGEEEKDYILMVAESLIKYQVQTATNEEEVNYLKRLGLL